MFCRTFAPNLDYGRSLRPTIRSGSEGKPCEPVRQIHAFISICCDSSSMALL